MQQTSKTEGVIYFIVNKFNGKKYVGQTVNPKKRWKEHRNKHDDTPIDNDISKYGYANFEFIVIEKDIPIESLDEREIYWIKYFDSFKNGYNCTIGGHVLKGQDNLNYGNGDKIKGEKNPFYGKKHSEKSLQKIKEAHKDCSGKNHPQYGKHLSDETKAKISKVRTGTKRSAESIEKSRLAAIGRKHTSEYKAYISKINKGENNAMYGIRGDKHPRAVLNREIALKIINDRKTLGLTHNELAQKYGTKPSTIGNILNGQHWTVKEIA